MIEILVTVVRILWQCECYIFIDWQSLFLPKRCNHLARINLGTQTFSLSLCQDLFKVVLACIRITLSWPIFGQSLILLYDSITFTSSLHTIITVDVVWNQSWFLIFSIICFVSSYRWRVCFCQKFSLASLLIR